MGQRAGGPGGPGNARRRPRHDCGGLIRRARAAALEAEGDPGGHDAALIEQKDRFVQFIVAEAGKPLRLARAEVDRAILTFKTAAEEVMRLGGETIPLDLTEGNEGRWGLVQRFPVGPVLAITPSNFPLNLVAHKLRRPWPRAAPSF